MGLSARSAGAVTRGRLTPVERAERAMKEIDLQRLLVGRDGIAPLFGWEHVHFRKGRTKDGWATSTSGSLGRGWPDLVLVRERDRRILFVELKRELEQPAEHQERVLEVLRSLAAGEPQPTPFPGTWTRVEVHVWRPSSVRDPIDQSVAGLVLR